MNLRDLEYIIAIDKYRHFGKAASACFVAQPTLSMQLKKFETYLGLQLFERTKQQVLVTHEGKKIIEIARKIQEYVKQLRATAKQIQEPFSGVCTLGAFPTMAPYWLPNFVQLIHAQYPNLKLQIIEEKSNCLLNMLNSGEIDLCFVVEPKDKQKFNWTPVWSEPYYLAVPAGHHLSSKTEISLAELKDEAMLVLESGHCLRDHLLDLFERHQVQINSQFYGTSLETLRQMVTAGTGVTLIPKCAINSQSGITYINIKESGFERHIGIATRRSIVNPELSNAIYQLAKSLA